MQEPSETAGGREAQAAGHAASVCAKGLKPEPAAGPPWKDAFSAEEMEGGQGSFVTSQDGSDFLAYPRSDRTDAGAGAGNARAVHDAHRFFREANMQNLHCKPRFF